MFFLPWRTSINFRMTSIGLPYQKLQLITSSEVSHVDNVLLIEEPKCNDDDSAPGPVYVLPKAVTRPWSPDLHITPRIIPYLGRNYRFPEVMSILTPERCHMSCLCWHVMFDAYSNPPQGPMSCPRLPGRLKLKLGVSEVLYNVWARLWWSEVPPNSYPRP